MIMLKKIRTVKTMCFSGFFLKFLLKNTLTLDYGTHVNKLITFKLHWKGSKTLHFHFAPHFTLPELSA